MPIEKINKLGVSDDVNIRDGCFRGVSDLLHYIGSGLGRNLDRFYILVAGLEGEASCNGFRDGGRGWDVVTDGLESVLIGDVPGGDII